MYTRCTTGYTLEKKVPSGIEMRGLGYFRPLDEDLRKCYEGKGDCPIDDYQNLESFMNLYRYNGTTGIFGFIEGATATTTHRRPIIRYFY